VKTVTVTSLTPAFHDILIQNVTSTGTAYGSSAKAYFPIYIYGLPESYVKNVTFDNVQISAQKGMFLAFCDVNFINGCNITNGKNSTRYFEQQYDATVTGKYDGSDATGITSAQSGETEVKSVSYYDMEGRCVDGTTAGMIVEKTVMADGTTSAKKIINR
jgi:hypothetical protein